MVMKPGKVLCYMFLLAILGTDRAQKQKNTIGDYFCHNSYSIFPLSRNWPGMQLFLNCFLACLFAFFNCLLNIKRVYNEPCLLFCVCRRIRGLFQLPTGHVSLY